MSVLRNPIGNRRRVNKLSTPASSSTPPILTTELTNSIRAGTRPLRVLAGDDRWRGDVDNPVRMVGFNLTLLFVFIRLTEVHDIISTKLGFDSLLLYIVGVPAFAALVLSGGFRRTLGWRPVWYWAGFVGWLCLASPFSIYVMGSLRLTFSFIRSEGIVLLLIAGLAMTWRECWRLLNVFALASAVNILIGKLLGAANIDNRRELAIGTMSDSNDYAATLVLLLPFLLMVTFTPGRALVLRLAAIAFTVYGAYLALTTGSRGALVAMIVAVLFAMSKLPLRFLVPVTVVLIAFCLAFITVLPERAYSRLSSLVTGQDGEAAASAESRSYLLKTSLLYTITHPLFGVGPGEFSDYEGVSSREQGYRGNWHETHNSFTQVSSEAGIPAFIFFLAAVVSTYRLISRLHRRAREQQPTLQNRQMVCGIFTVLVSMIGFCTAIMFLSLAYRFFLPEFTGVAIALARAAQHEWGIPNTVGLKFRSQQ
jgi:O-antigen ligase